MKTPKLVVPRLYFSGSQSRVATLIRVSEVLWLVANS